MVLLCPLGAGGRGAALCTPGPAKVCAAVGTLHLAVLSTAPSSMDPFAQAVLVWDQRLAPHCDRSEAVKAGVEAYLGRPVFGAGSSLVIRVRILRPTIGGPTVATVTQEDESGRAWGERSVSGPDCESLDDPLTLVVALMVDSSSAVEGSAAEPPVPAEPVAPTRPVVVETSNEPIETAPSLQRPRHEPGHWAVFGSGLATMGFLPEPGIGVAIDARLKPARFWGLSIDAALLAKQQVAVDGGRIAFDLAHAGLGLCPLHGSDATTWWSACGTFSVGWLRARSRGLIGARSKSEVFGMPGLSVAGAWLPRGWFFLGAGLSGFFPVSPDRYLYRDALETTHLAFQMSSFALTAKLSVGLLVR